MSSPSTVTVTRLEDYDLSGYIAGRPPTNGFIDGPGIDAECANGSTCEACGHVGMEYRPYTTKPFCGYGDMGGYRAFAVCPDCGNAVEF